MPVTKRAFSRAAQRRLRRRNDVFPTDLPCARLLSPEMQRLSRTSRGLDAVTADTDNGDHAPAMR
jgi:hypothetical protein